MVQEAGEKWAAAVDLRPTIPKSDRLLGRSFELRLAWISTAGMGLRVSHQPARAEVATRLSMVT